MNDDVLLHVNPFAWRPCSETHPMIGCRYERPSARSDSNAMACSRVGAPSHGAGVGRFCNSGLGALIWYRYGGSLRCRLFRSNDIYDPYRQYTRSFRFFIRKVQLHIIFSHSGLGDLIGYRYGGSLRCRLFRSNDIYDPYRQYTRSFRFFIRKVQLHIIFSHSGLGYLIGYRYGGSLKCRLFSSNDIYDPYRQYTRSFRFFIRKVQLHIIFSHSGLGNLIGYRYGGSLKCRLFMYPLTIVD